VFSESASVIFSLQYLKASLIVSVVTVARKYIDEGCLVLYCIASDDSLRKNAVGSCHLILLRCAKLMHPLKILTHIHGIFFFRLLKSIRMNVNIYSSINIALIKYPTSLYKPQSRQKPKVQHIDVQLIDFFCFVLKCRG
jgi:hypothetical protein